jgi:hypothetical protein
LMGRETFVRIHPQYDLPIAVARDFCKWVTIRCRSSATVSVSMICAKVRTFK